MPQRGYVESALEAEQMGVDSFLYDGTEVPSEPELLERVILEASQ
jgi:hypothetical protein